MKCKKILIGVILVVLFFGICGCANHNKNREKILDELEIKYKKDFEIIKLSYEISGDGNGFYYRAVCKEKNSDITFVAYYYLNDSSLFDDYTTSLLNEKVAEYLVSSNIGIDYAIVDINTVAHALTIDDITKGVEYCLSNDDFKVKVSAYVFINGDEQNNLEVENKIINKLSGLNLYTCNLDIVYIEDSLFNYIKQDYLNDSDIESRLENDNRISSYKRYRITDKDGVSFLEVVK